MKVTKNQKKHLLKRAGVVSSYKHVFKGNEGTTVLHDMMANHFMLKPTFDTDPLKMAHNEGQRAVILRILTYMKVNPEQLKERIEAYEESLDE